MISGLALVVVIVIDQFRADELLRAQKNLNPAGIGRLVNQGIFYDDTHHTNFFNMTCPGHVAISTGAPSGLNGIIINDEWDAQNKKPIYCVADPQNTLIDAPKDTDPDLGTSAKRIMTTTVGDELKLINQDQSRVVSVSVKDRAAIGLGGHAIDGAFWLAPKSHVWTSSTAYFPNKKLPSWIETFNKHFAQRKTTEAGRYEQTSQSVIDTTDLALAAVEGEKLGQHPKPDILWVSYSAHDFVGHQFGDESLELQKIFKSEDENIARLLSTLQKKMGGKKFLVALTGDHGAGVSSSTFKDHPIPGGKLNEEKTTEALNKCMSEKGFKAKNGPLRSFSMNFYLSDEIRDKKQARIEAKECLNRMSESVWQAYTRDEILSGDLPNVPWLKNLALSYYPARGSDVVGVLLPYWNSHDSSPLTHETPYDYDSWVPLAIWWNGISHKQVHQRTSVISLAPTLARILETRRPSGATADFLTEVLDQAR